MLILLLLFIQTKPLILSQLEKDYRIIKCDSLTYVQKKDDLNIKQVYYYTNLKQCMFIIVPPVLHDSNRHCHSVEYLYSNGKLVKRDKKIIFNNIKVQY